MYALFDDTQKSSGLMQAIIGGTISLALDIVGIVLYVVGLTAPVPLALLILGVTIGIYSHYVRLSGTSSGRALHFVRPHRRSCARNRLRSQPTRAPSSVVSHFGLDRDSRNFVHDITNGAPDPREPSRTGLK